MNIRRKLLWIDSLAGLTVGIAVLLAAGWLQALYQLPIDLLYFTGTVNVAYGLYSLSLVVRSKRPPNLIKLLVVANLTWAVICLWLAYHFSNTASPFGLAHLFGEGIFVGSLALLEWRFRELLQTA